MIVDRIAPSRPLRAALSSLLVLLVSAAWAAWQHGDLVPDPENRAMKSDRPDRVAVARRVQSAFGSDHVLLLTFAAAPGLAIADDEAARLDRVRDRLLTLPGVGSCTPPREVDPGLAVLEVVVDSAARPSRAEVARRAVECAEGLRPGTLVLRATGQPLAEFAIATALDRERREVVPWVAAVLFVLLWVTLRSARLAAIVLAPAGISIAWTSALFARLGHRLDPISSLLEPVVLTVGVAAGVHVVEAWRRGDPAEPAAAAIARVRRELARPTVLAVATTMIGFLALLPSPIPAVRSFALFASFGVTAATWLALLAVPLWLAGFGPRSRPASGRRDPSGYVAWLHLRGSRIVCATVALTLVAASGWASLRVDNDPLRVLPSADGFRADTDWLLERVGGVETFGLWVPAGGGPPAAELAAVLGAAALEDPAVAGPAGPPLSACNGDLLLRGVLAPGGSAARERLFDRLERVAASLGRDDVRVVGTAAGTARDSGALVRAQLAGIGVTLVLLGVVLTLGLRSWRLGLIGLLPNAIPCVVIYGVTAALDRSLSVATAMIGSTMMGLIVDDTAHFLHGVRVAGRSQPSPRVAVAAALGMTARPITITSAVLACGLSMASLSRLESTREFGAMAAATVVLAWVSTMTVLPALVLRSGLERRAVA